MHKFDIHGDTITVSFSQSYQRLYTFMGKKESSNKIIYILFVLPQQQYY